MRISLIGAGHIGKAVIGILNENKNYFLSKFGEELEVISVSGGFSI